MLKTLLPMLKTMLPFILALGTALCWGLYGPTIGQANRVATKGVDTPFKPYVGIGTAYLVIAIIGGLIAMRVVGTDTWKFTDLPSRWGFAAGILGAGGALFLTLSMFNGGSRIPHAVMPFVFGGAVTVTALFSAYKLHTRGNVWMWLGIVGMGVCAVVVAYNTPHSHAPKPEEKPQASSAGPISETATTSPDRL